jgi:hypothetical protein
MKRWDVCGKTGSRYVSTTSKRAIYLCDEHGLLVNKTMKDGRK